MNTKQLSQIHGISLNTPADHVDVQHSGVHQPARQTSKTQLLAQLAEELLQREPAVQEHRENAKIVEKRAKIKSAAEERGEF